jgi:hypothetical protein
MIPKSARRFSDEIMRKESVMLPWESLSSLRGVQRRSNPEGIGRRRIGSWIAARPVGARNDGCGAFVKMRFALERMIPKSGHRFSDEIVRKESMIPKSGHRFSDGRIEETKWIWLQQ